MSIGLLTVQLSTGQKALPVTDATVEISRTSETGQDTYLTTVSPDRSGNCPSVEIDAPPQEYSLQPLPGEDHLPGLSHHPGHRHPDLRGGKHPPAGTYAAAVLR